MATEEQASRNHRAACRLSQRPGDQRRGGADLPDDELSVPRHRARREPVRAEGARQHLHPHHEPDQRRAGAAGRRARRRRRGLGARLGPGGLAVCRQQHRAGRRQFRQLDRPLRRHLEPVRATRCSARWASRCRFVDPADPENFRRATDARTRCYYAETLPNPKLEVFPIARGRQDRPRTGRAADHGQHRGAGDLPAARPWRRDRHALDDQISSAATAPRSAASSSMAAISTGRHMPTASRC